MRSGAGLVGRLWTRVRLHLRGGRYHAELAEEMRLHREMLEQELRATGTEPGAARHEAARRFGNSTRLGEQSWEAVGFGLGSVVQDVRFAARRLRQSPGFTLTAVLTLALGVGAVTTIFSVVYGVLVDPFPYKDVQTLVTPKLCSPEFSRCGWDSYSPSQFLELASKTDLFSGVSASTISDVTLTGAGMPQHLRGNYITPGTFAVLGVTPLLGRAANETDVLPGHGEVAILSDRYWKSHFGGSRSVLGRVVTLNGRPRVVVGVMPPRVLFRGADVYLPIRMVGAPAVDGQQNFTFVGRLKAGTTVKGVEGKAAAELELVFRDFARADPRGFPNGLRVGLLPFDEMFQSGLADALYLLLGAVGVLLLIACVNVSSLMLARGVSREHELAVRAALGASRLRLLRASLVEGLLVATLAVPVALGVAWGGLQATLRLVPPETIPDEAAVSLNLPVLAACLGLALAAVLAAGLAPAWQSARPRPAEALSSRRSSRSRGQRRTLRGFVVAEMALSLTLLMLAGVMIRNLMAVDRQPLPFAPDHTAMLRIELDKSRYPTAAERIAFFRELTARAERLPGARAATVDSAFPFFGGNAIRVQIHGEPYRDRQHITALHLTDSAFLSTARMHMLSGHFLTDSEMAEHAQDAVISALFAKRFFPGLDPLGRIFRIPDFNEDDGAALITPAFTVVGVSDDLPSYPGYDEQLPEVFLPYTVAPTVDTVIVSTKLPAEQMLRPLQKLVYSIDPDQAISDEATLRHILDMYGYAGPRFTLALFGTFAVAALALALVGIYGVFSFLAAERRLEIGIRMALGANRTAVVWMMLGEALLLALLGVGVGLPLALVAGHLAGSELSGVSRFDPLTLLAVACLLPLFAVAGVCLPAWRAAATEPVDALRGG